MKNTKNEWTPLILSSTEYGLSTLRSHFPEWYFFHLPDVAELFKHAHDAVMTPVQRNHVAATPVSRHFNARCPLGDFDQLPNNMYQY